MKRLLRCCALSICAATSFAQLPTVHYAWTRNGARAPQNLGDVDGDGVSDLLVTCVPPGGVGFAEIRSGASGAVVRTVFGLNVAEYFGAASAPLGDANGDGVPDFAVSAPLATVPGSGAPGFGLFVLIGALRAFSGATGAPLWTAYPTGTNANYALQASAYWHVSPVGDVDGDGVVDLAAGRTGGGATCGFGGNIYAPAMMAGRIEVVSGATGAVVRTHDGTIGDVFPTDVAGVGDFDGDGVGDYAAAGVGRSGFSLQCLQGSPPMFFPALPSQVRVYSGATGAELFAALGPVATFARVGKIGDLNGDGFADLGVGVTLAAPASTHLLVHNGPFGAASHAYVYWTAPATQPYLSGVGDRNGDGYDDYVMPGPLGGPEIRSGLDATLIGTLAPTTLGTTMNLLGDLAGDGLGEIGTVGTLTPGSSVPSSVVLATPFAGAAAAVTVVGVGCAPSGSAPTLFAPLPLLGSAWSMSVAASPPFASFLAVAGVPAAVPLPLGGGCDVLLDLAAPLFAGPTIVIDATGAGAAPPVPLPLTVTLAGFAFRAQAVAFIPGGLALTNGLDLVFGF